MATDTHCVMCTLVHTTIYINVINYLYGIRTGQEQGWNKILSTKRTKIFMQLCDSISEMNKNDKNHYFLWIDLLAMKKFNKHESVH